MVDIKTMIRCIPTALLLLLFCQCVLCHGLTSYFIGSLDNTLTGDTVDAFDGVVNGPADAFFLKSPLVVATDYFSIEFKLSGTNSTNRVCVIAAPTAPREYIEGEAPPNDENTVCFQQTSSAMGPGLVYISWRGRTYYDATPTQQNGFSNVYRFVVDHKGLVHCYQNGVVRAAITITAAQFSLYGVLSAGAQVVFLSVNTTINAYSLSSSLTSTTQPDSAYTGGTCISCNTGAFLPFDARIGKPNTGYRQTSTNDFLQISLASSHVITHIDVESVTLPSASNSFFAVRKFTLSSSNDYNWDALSTALTTPATSGAFTFTSIRDTNNAVVQFNAFNDTNGGGDAAPLSGTRVMTIALDPYTIPAAKAVRISGTLFYSTNGYLILKADIKGYATYKAGPYLPLGMASGSIPAASIQASSCPYCPFGLYLPTYGRVNQTGNFTSQQAFMGSVGEYMQISFGTSSYYVTALQMQALFIAPQSANYAVTRYKLSYATNATIGPTGYLTGSSQDAAFTYVMDPVTSQPMIFSNPVSPVTTAVAPTHLGCASTFVRTQLTTLLYTSLTSNTIQACNVAALQAGFAYFGVEYFRECWVGVAFDSNRLENTNENCTYPCSGDSTQVCGGLYHSSVYRVNGFVPAEWGSTNTLSVGTPFVANALRIHAVTCLFNCAFRTEVFGQYAYPTFYTPTPAPTTPVPTTLPPTTSPPPTTPPPTTPVPTTASPTVNPAVVTAVSVTTAFRMSVNNPAAFANATNDAVVRFVIAQAMGVDSSLITNVRLSQTAFSLSSHKHRARVMAMGFVYVAFDAPSYVAVQFFTLASTTIAVNMQAFGFIVDPSYVITLTATTLTPTTSTPTTATPTASMAPTQTFGIPFDGPAGPYLNAIIIQVRVIVDSPTAFVANPGSNNTLVHLIALSLHVPEDRISNLTLATSFNPLHASSFHAMSLGFVYVTFSIIDLTGHAPHTNDLALAFLQESLVTNSELAVNMRLNGITIDTGFTPLVKIGPIVDLVVIQSTTIPPTTAAPSTVAATAPASSSSSTISSEHYIIAGAIAGGAFLLFLMGFCLFRCLANQEFATRVDAIARDAYEKIKQQASDVMPSE